MAKHHPFGPSRQKELSICCGTIPIKNRTGGGEHPVTRQGTIGHNISDSGDRDLADQVDNPEELLGWVDDFHGAWHLTLSNFVSEFGPHSPVLNEYTLESEGLNFGTVDKLVISVSGTAGLIGDLKFGAWSVDPAESNLQGHNYAVLLWDSVPTVDDLWVFFGNPRRKEYSLAKFTRSQHYYPFRAKLHNRLTFATAAHPSTFSYDPVNCSFCGRWDCPVRIDHILTLASNNSEVTKMFPKDLAFLKSQTNVMKVLAKQIDEEAKKRMLEDGEEIPGYEIIEKVRSREVIGQKNIQTLVELLSDHVSCSLQDLVSVSFSDVEQLVLDVCPGKQGKQIISQLVDKLNEVGALTTNSYFALAAKKD